MANPEASLPEAVEVLFDRALNSTARNSASSIVLSGGWIFSAWDHAGERRSKAVYVDHGLGKSLRSFLGQIVSDAAGDEAILILA